MTTGTVTQLPTVVVSAGGVSALKAGEFATITFTFSEDPGSSFEKGDITVTGGTLGALSDKVNNGNGTFSYTATYTPTDKASVGGAVSVGNGVFTDLAGNANVDGDESNNKVAFSIDTVRPTVSIQSGSSNNTLKADEPTVVTFVFSEDPVSFTWNEVAQSGSISVNGGKLGVLSGSGLVRTATATFTDNVTVTAGEGNAWPKYQLVLDNNTIREAVYSANASSSNNLVFIYTIANGASASTGDTDSTGGITANANALLTNGATVKDANNNNALVATSRVDGLVVAFGDGANLADGDCQHRQDQHQTEQQRRHGSDIAGPNAIGELCRGDRHLYV